MTIVEPAAFRTNRSGPSMRESAVRIADYADTAGARRAATRATYGRQPGDSDRAAAAIAAVVDAPGPPLRLLLGEGAVQIVDARLDVLRDGFAVWGQVGLDADFPPGT
ncbi:hypothetical protein [Embleya hyalina]|uniref:Short-chain dehydrogenase/reductase n=1 Tax=Embleya hyalina TaxID=516124 RepID=A0A401YCS7_9ACTN|nr:hypothetical protein [Embleya hyalina]GCD92409.1 short-chain dehydrogenase/reductase [Embleya hyalina]